MSAKKYSQEFKDSAVKQVLSGETSMAQLARNPGINVNTLLLWKKNYLKWQGDPSALKEGEEDPRSELERLRRENRQLREERDILKKSRGYCLEGAVSRYLFVKEHANQFHVSMMCLTLDVSTSGYYAWRERPESDRDKENQILLEQIKAVHKESRGAYGNPRIYKRLKKKGIKCNRKRVARLMQKHNIRAKRKRRFVKTTDSRHDFKVAQNLLSRSFQVDTLDTVWLGDITCIPTDEGWLYLASVLDLCSKRVVGWSLSSSLDRTVALDALRMAYQSRRPSAGLVHHSDRGVQYASDDYQNLLRVYGMNSSMSRKGDCWDNAPMESFFASLKQELIYQRHFESREQARREIFDYIEIFYNRQRLHSSSGYMSPAEYEAAMISMAA